MSPHPPTLMIEGHVEDIVDDARDGAIAHLTMLVKSLREELAAAQREADRARRESTVALAALRRQLSPLYKALQAVFGELDAAGVDASGDTHAEKPLPTRHSAIWESWKARLPGGPSKIIDALMVHGEMNTQQLAIATGVHRNSIPTMIYKLNQAGLINKNGGRFSLKTLPGA